MTNITVIVVTYNNAGTIRACLDALHRATRRVQSSVVVIDNASTDATVEAIRQSFPSVQLIINQKNVGFAAAVNRGLTAVAQSNVLLLNPDTEIAEESIEALHNFLEAHPTVGIVGGRLNDPQTGKAHSSFGWFPTIGRELAQAAHLEHLGPVGRYPVDSWFNRRLFAAARPVDWVGGGLMFIRRPVIERVGAFDERFFLYMEDVDYCHRAHDAGLAVWYAPAVRARHVGGHSFSPKNRQRTALFRQSLKAYFEKYNLPRWLLSLV